MEFFTRHIMHVRNTCGGRVGGAQKSKESVVEHTVSFRQCIRCRWLTFRSKVSSKVQVTFWLFFQYYAATCVVAIVERAASVSLTVLFVFATMFVTVKRSRPLIVDPSRPALSHGYCGTASIDSRTGRLGKQQKSRIDRRTLEECLDK